MMVRIWDYERKYDFYISIAMCSYKNVDNIISHQEDFKINGVFDQPRDKKRL